MSSDKTIRSLRVSDDLWEEAKRAAYVRGTTPSTVMLAYLREWTADPEAMSAAVLAARLMRDEGYELVARKERP